MKIIAIDLKLCLNEFVAGSELVVLWGNRRIYKYDKIPPIITKVKNG